MKQQTLAMAADQGAGFETCHKRTRRDELLDTMNTIEIRLEQRRGRRRGSGGNLFAEVGRVLQASGMKLASGTMVDRKSRRKASLTMNLPLFAPESMNTTGWFSVALRYRQFWTPPRVLPVGAVAREPRHFSSAYNADLAQTNFGNHTFKPATRHAARS